MRAFISHITEESGLATCLKEWIESTLLGQCDVFVSSDSTAVPAGVKWLQEIDQALRTANVFFVICSAQSLPRPWVNFETGCAWARGIPIVPLCHSGVTRSTLPRPIGDFQAIDLSDARFPQLFFEALQAHFQLTRMPRIDQPSMKVDLSRALANISESSTTVSETLVESDVPALHDECIKILHYLGQHTERLSCRHIAAYFKRSEQQTKFFIEQLSNARLIRTALNARTGASYELNEQGRRYLFEHDML